MLPQLRTVVKNEGFRKFYGSWGTIIGAMTGTVALCRTDLPQYTRIAKQDPTGLLDTKVAYGVVTLAKAGAVGVVTGAL